MQSDTKLALLDCKIHRSELTNKFEWSVYRKGTFSGLGASCYSICCLNFKLNGIRTLFSRACKICSNYSFIHSEFEFLTNYFTPMVSLDFLSNHVCIDFGGMFLNPMFMIPVTILLKRCVFNSHILALNQKNLRRNCVLWLENIF